MKNLVILVVMLSSMAAHAEKLQCIFNEPFINISVDTEKGVAVYSPLDCDTPWTCDAPLQDVKVVQMGKDHYRIDLLDDNRMYLIVKINNKGSDGMSDYIYPFDAFIGDAYSSSKNWGGCYSDLKPKSGKEYL